MFFSLFCSTVCIIKRFSQEERRLKEEKSHLICLCLHIEFEISSPFSSISVCQSATKFIVTVGENINHNFAIIKRARVEVIITTSASYSNAQGNNRQSCGGRTAIDVRNVSLQTSALCNSNLDASNNEMLFASCFSFKIFIKRFSCRLFSS